MASPDLITIYYLAGCQLRQCTCRIHPKMTGVMALGSPSSPSVSQMAGTAGLWSTRARGVPSCRTQGLPVPRARSLNAPLPPETTAPASTYRSSPKSHACPRSGRRRRHPCSPGTERESSWLAGTDTRLSVHSLLYTSQTATLSQILQLPIRETVTEILALRAFCPNQQWDPVMQECGILGRASETGQGASCRQTARALGQDGEGFSGTHQSKRTNPTTTH